MLCCSTTWTTTLAEVVQLNQGRAVQEASGNMTAERLLALDRIGIDIVSIGGLIHQATWADLSMRFDGASGHIDQT